MHLHTCFIPGFPELDQDGSSFAEDVLHPDPAKKVNIIGYFVKIGNYSAYFTAPQMLSTSDKAASLREVTKPFESSSDLEVGRSDEELK